MPRSKTIAGARRRVLTLLADTAEGATEAVLMANGITPKIIAGLVEARLATTHAAQMHAGKRAIEVTRIKITDAGRQALDD